MGAEILAFTSWRGVFGVLGVSGLLMLAAVYYGLEETLPQPKRSAGGLRNTLDTFRELLGHSAFMGYALTQGLIMAAMFAYISGSSFVLQEVYGVSPREYAMVFALNGAGIIVASQMAGRLAGRVDARAMLGAGLSISLAGALLLLLTLVAGGGLAGIIPAFFLVVSSVGIISTTTASLALQEQGQRAGSASALLGMLSFIFGGAAAPLVGLGGEGSAMPLAIVILLLSAGASCCFAVLTRRRT